jgi:polyferredoxin
MMLPGSSVTASRKKVYPRHFDGRFRQLRNAISLSLQALLFLLPWWQWQGRQAVLIDIRCPLAQGVAFSTFISRLTTKET